MEIAKNTLDKLRILEHKEKAIESAYRDYTRTLKMIYPVGTIIDMCRNSGLKYEVIGYGNGREYYILRVKNVKTGKEKRLWHEEIPIDGIPYCERRINKMRENTEAQNV